MDAEKPGGNLGMVINDVYVGKQLPEKTEAALSAAVRNNVLRQVELTTGRSDVLKKAVEEKKLKIVAGVYHLDSGNVEWFDK